MRSSVQLAVTFGVLRRNSAKRANSECFFSAPPTPKCFNSLMDAAAANSPSPWRDDAGLAWRTRKLQTEKALATRGFEPLLSAGLQCKPPSHSQPNYPKWKEILTWRCYKTNLLFNVSFLTEKKRRIGSNWPSSCYYKKLGNTYTHLRMTAWCMPVLDRWTTVVQFIF